MTNGSLVLYETPPFVCGNAHMAVEVWDTLYMVSARIVGSSLEMTEPGDGHLLSN